MTEARETLLDKRELEDSDEESKSVEVHGQVSGLANSKSLLMLILSHC